MSSDSLLTEKHREILAVGASIAAGCQPCARYHLQAARVAGAGDQEIRQAVCDALRVRARASRVMAELAEQESGGVPGRDHAGDPADSDEAQPSDPLVAFGAAYAVNCSTQVQTYAKAAWHMGLGEAQIAEALSIAQMVKEAAGKKARAAIQGLADAAAHCAGNGCDCRTDKSAPGMNSTEPAPADAGCGCQ